MRLNNTKNYNRIAGKRKFVLKLAFAFDSIEFLRLIQSKTAKKKYNIEILLLKRTIAFFYLNCKIRCILIKILEYH